MSGRLRVAVLVAAAGLAACSTEPSGSVEPTTSTSGAVTTTTAPLLPAALPYAPAAGEVEPEAKAAAASFLQKVLTYDLGAGTVEGARLRLAATVAAPEAVDKLAPLLRAGAAGEADVVYPQLGGFAASKASIMAVVRLRTLEGGLVETVTRTFDVRVEKQQGRWGVVDVASLGGDPVPRPETVSAAAEAVLEHPQIDLPDSARWDIHAGRIDDRVLRILASIADAQPVGVTVLSTGHPIEVFGSDHVSNHIPGRGVDLWKIGVPVIDQRRVDQPLRPLVERLLAEGVTELGAPFDIDGPRGANFANLVHQDHLHIAYDRA